MLQTVRQKIWRAIYPVFPQVERRLLFLHEKKRQAYHIGWLAPHHSLASLKKHLAKQWGFGNHFVAWEDTEQVLSWRKLDSFQQQYHLRLYADGEIRGHYEWTPEASAVKHFLSADLKAKTKDFLKFLGTFVVLKKHITHIHSGNRKAASEAEVTFHS
jgi:hypothetical protein